MNAHMNDSIAVFYHHNHRFYIEKDSEQDDLFSRRRQ